MTTYSIGSLARTDSVRGSYAILTIAPSRA
jgi:hypothetical protein